jgi:F-type H+-transporting ATPase subunit a
MAKAIRFSWPTAFVLALLLVIATDVAARAHQPQEPSHDNQAQTTGVEAASQQPTEAHAEDDGNALSDTHGEGLTHADGEAHGEEDDHGGIAHLTNWLTVIISLLHDEHGEKTATAEFLERFENPIFSGVTAILLMVLFARIYTRRSQDPGRLQVAAEMMLGGLYNLFEIILGHHARRFVPYLGTLFLFILINNLMGLVPLMHSSTSAINTTAALAICTFLYVQGIGIKENGILGYLHHMAGSPRSAMDWGFSLLLFPLHLLGEFIKPMSLSLRLFGNIFGEDTLIATMVVLGAGLLSFVANWFPGVPLQFPFIFLAMLTSTIQALVFALLSTVYIALMLPHEEHAEAHGH